MIGKTIEMAPGQVFHFNGVRYRAPEWYPDVDTTAYYDLLTPMGRSWAGNFVEAHEGKFVGVIRGLYAADDVHVLPHDPDACRANPYRSRP